MSALSTEAGYWILGLFGASMILLTVLVSTSREWTSTSTGFLYAGRKVSTVFAAFGIAASWIWAPALFVSVQKSYELGLAGLFWFTVPNVIAVLMYIVIGPAIRRQVPGGYSIPDWIRHRFTEENPAAANIAHKLFLIPHIWYQIMAVTVQIFVGGLILNYLTGIPLDTGMLALLGITLAYSLISGLRASVFTDFVQMSLILLGLAIVVPWLVSIVGWDRVAAGFGGTSKISDVLDPGVAFSFGIVTSIGLIAGSVADQQFWQRAFAIREDRLFGAFVLGGLVFAVVPVTISVLGFVAAAPGSGVELPPGTGLPMIGVATVVAYLPSWVTVVFVVMLLAGLASTLDSGFAAGASLYAIDIRSKSPAEKAVIDKQRIGAPLSPDEEKTLAKFDADAVWGARASMVILAIVGYGVAIFVKNIFPLDRLWWLFNGVATMFVIPTILSIFWPRLSVRGVIVGLLLSLVGMVGFVYGNYVQNDTIVVYSALFMVFANLVACVLFQRRNAWKGRDLASKAV